MYYFYTHIFNNVKFCVSVLCFFFYRVEPYTEVCTYCITKIIFLVNIISTSSIKHLKYMQEVPHSHNFTSKLSRTSLRSSCVPLLPVLLSYQHVSWQFQPMLTSFLTGKREHNLVLITFTERLECSAPCRVKYRNGSEK